MKTSVPYSAVSWRGNEQNDAGVIWMLVSSSQMTFAVTSAQIHQSRTREGITVILSFQWLGFVGKIHRERGENTECLLVACHLVSL